MKLCIATALVLATLSPVTAQPAQPSRPAPPAEPAPGKPQRLACAVTGSPIFEIRKLVEGSKESSSAKLYKSGALITDTTTNEGKAGDSSRICVDKDALAKIQTDIKTSPWKTSRAQITCKAYSTSYTEYFVNGKQVYTHRLCGAEILDEKSAKNLQDIESLLK